MTATTTTETMSYTLDHTVNFATNAVRAEDQLEDLADRHLMVESMTQDGSKLHFDLCDESGCHWLHMFAREGYFSEKEAREGGMYLLGTLTDADGQAWNLWRWVEDNYDE